MKSLITSFHSFIPPPKHSFILNKKSSSIPQSLPKTSSRTPSSSFSFINALEDLINKFIDPPTRSSSINPTMVLSKNFAPVDELPPSECHDIEGTIPTCLNGAYIRNGPNPQFFPCGPYHLFDGDGMIHCLLIYNGKVTLSSRFVKTNKLVAEHKVGTSFLPNFVAGTNGFLGSLARTTLVIARVISEKYDTSKGIGVANTSITFFGNRIFALCESDLPYELRLTPDGNIQTIGLFNFHGDLVLRMTAHPKFDHQTKEGFAFFYDALSPFLTYFRFDSNGNKHKDVPIFSMKQPSYCHDFLITKKFAIFPDIQIIIDPLRMFLRGGSFLHFDPKKVSKVGVIPRYSIDEKDLRWFYVPGFNMLHAINAWDDIDEDGNETIIIVATNSTISQNTFDQLEDLVILVEKFKIDLKIGLLVSRQTLSKEILDLPVINQAYVGKKNKYVYASLGDPLPKIKGVVKLDMSLVSQDCIVARRMYEPGCYGGEPLFVARDSQDLDATEDDGFLITYLHDDNTGESRFLVMDAKTPNLDIVASVKLPQRVPYGFHGLFVEEKDLKAMWDSK